MKITLLAYAGSLVTLLVLDAIWLGLVALVASGLQQTQLSTSVVEGAVADAQMMKLMGHTMAQMEHHHGGHTHEGHADCVICGATDAMAFMTVSVPPPLMPPMTFARQVYVPSQAFSLAAVFAASYSSRAPPAVTL